MDIQSVLTIACAVVVGMLTFYGGFRVAIRQVGKAIPGDDPIERFDQLLTEKVDGIVAKIEEGVDLLNPKTHGGAGKAKK